MTDRTRRARSGSGVRRARLEGGKRNGAGREPRLKAGQAKSPAAPTLSALSGGAFTRCRRWRNNSVERQGNLLHLPDAAYCERRTCWTMLVWASGASRQARNYGDGEWAGARSVK